MVTNSYFSKKNLPVDSFVTIEPLYPVKPLFSVILYVNGSVVNFLTDFFCSKVIILLKINQKFSLNLNDVVLMSYWKCCNDIFSKTSIKLDLYS